MSESPKNFLKAIDKLDITHLGRAIALLWWYDSQQEGCFKTPREIADDIESAGYGKQNPSRLSTQLRKSNMTRKGSSGSYGIKVSARGPLDEAYRQYVNHIPVPETDSVIPRELFQETPSYIRKVVRQINASYDSGLHDCCAVMCRRLLETLVIAIYIDKGRSDELKDADGHFRMFAHLLNHVENDSRLNLGRNVVKGLKAFKTLGDQSAHDRTFNAVKNDIDRVRDGLRVASEALLHESGFYDPKCFEQLTKQIKQ